METCVSPSHSLPLSSHPAPPPGPREAKPPPSPKKTARAGGPGGEGPERNHVRGGWVRDKTREGWDLVFRVFGGCGFWGSVGTRLWASLSSSASSKPLSTPPTTHLLPPIRTPPSHLYLHPYLYPYPCIHTCMGNSVCMCVCVCACVLACVCHSLTGRSTMCYV